VSVKSCTGAGETELRRLASIAAAKREILRRRRAADQRKHGVATAHFRERERRARRCAALPQRRTFIAEREAHTHDELFALGDVFVERERPGGGIAMRRAGQGREREARHLACR
jgi:hypothetical protein